MAFYLTKRAKTDLKDIARYTQNKRGIPQRNRYLAQIDEAFYDLDQKPKLGRDCGYMKYGGGRETSYFL